ncbi:ethanolamine utilization protein EutA [Trichococcus flocculiformis]|uniref:ethanolamine ammonia-lyase reactivating factor EutA n=1 Tax=Carnobacteriaceae TaxID=186828 RepID=UPI0007A8B51C|nr:MULTISPECIES: ethanolamine ammonia-lyase reactivating factor EutA [Carnobacteriaceae]MDE1548759.1 ethanolamine ammonia-lyase reactivating factor EutA [Jeotgalibaca caeni]CZR08965.1 ethanolamine utilisation euta [Trichococcus sp. ES5]SHG08667.1 ethanolamine utilization protein EutA [Trichococcus flocculiformis]
MAEKLLSVGIDIGTSTTQLVLSELYIENMASAFTIPRISITDKKVIYKSDILFTPILTNNLIDANQIKRFVEQQYQKAGVKQKDIQTGAIIITGETVRKENSRAVAEALSGFAGDFVVATAGPDLESIIAGKGAGTHSYSVHYHTTTVNFDIGGGTTNLVCFHDGDIQDTGCFDIGGRLIKVNEQRKITYIAPKLETIIQAERLQLRLNQTIDLTDLNKLLSIMVQVMENSLGVGEKSPYYDLLITNKDLRTERKVEYVSFSGGVADYIQKDTDEAPFKYGDIGILLGRKIAQSKLFEQFEVIESVETIRATVVGAGSHTTDVSGSTITYKDKILPLQNVPVLKLSKEDEDQASIEKMAQAIEEKLNWFEADGEQQLIALAFEGAVNPRFQYIQDLAAAIVKGLEKVIQKGDPLVILVKEDMAKALGHSLYAQLPAAYPFVCIDSVHVQNGDYIDIGNPIADGSVLPVVVKTLVFN